MNGVPITGHTGLTCLLGSPVAHSVSPAMHNDSFRYHGLDCVYLAFDVSPEEFETAVDGLIVMNARGWNCTMPHKRSMFERVNIRSKEAELIGAVNTVVQENGVLTGYNTDGKGYMRAVEDAGFNIIGKKMTILGTGGAAASIIAKVHRDHIMDQYDKEYSGYGFASNKGYGTAEHIEAIHRLGITPIHRKSFEPVKSMVMKSLVE